MDIRPFVGVEAGEGELRQAHALFVERVTGEQPGFPVPTFEAYAQRWQRGSTNHVGLRHAFGAWDGSRLIGMAIAQYPEHENLGYCQTEVDVTAAERRRGVATALLRPVVSDARAEGRGTIGVSSVRRGSPAQVMLASLGFTSVLEYEWNLLDFEAADPASWNVPVPAGFRIVHWRGSAPESLIAEYAAVRNAIHDMPTDLASYGEPRWTAERVRLDEAEAADRGEERWTVAAVDEASGAIAGNSVIMFMPGRVEICWQLDTAVARGFRGRGLGRVMKASMIRRIRSERPAVRFVSTGNAADNVHMIRVNRELGYSLLGNMANFEAGVDVLAERLGLPTPDEGTRN